MIPGPCVICGDTNYNLSCGGPTICPKCDCGNFDAATVMKQAKVIADLRSQLGKERHDVFAQCEALVCARILDWTAAVEGGVHESFATTVLEEFEDFLKSIRDARASGSNPVSKDASMEGRGVDPMLRGATSPTLTDDESNAAAAPIRSDYHDAECS